MSFEAYLGISENTVTVHVAGELDDSAVPIFRSLVDRATEQPVRRLVLMMNHLTSMSPIAVRCLALAQQKMGVDVEFILVGARSKTREMIKLAGFEDAVTLAESSRPAG